MERNNNTCKLIKRISFGFRNFRNMKSRIMIITNIFRKNKREYGVVCFKFCRNQYGIRTAYGEVHVGGVGRDYCVDDNGSSKYKIMRYNSEKGFRCFST